MFLNDYYLCQMERVVKRISDIEVFEWFKIYVLDMKLGSSISHQELVKEGHISLLINAGVLSRQLIDPDIYWYAIPNIGVLLRGLSQGRRDLLSLLNRRRCKEVMLASLEKKRLRLSPLDMRFHLRDLIGSAQLGTVNTPSGLVVRVSKD